MLPCTAWTTAVPNRAVQTVLGVHLLKEMFNLTDDEALEQLFNLLWHHALRLDIEETHAPEDPPQRVRLMQHDGGRLVQETNRIKHTHRKDGWTPPTS